MRSGAALSGLVAIAACSAAVRPAARDAAERGARCTWNAAPRPVGASEYRYRVAAGQGADELCVEVDLPRGTRGATWGADPVLAPFFRDVTVATSGPKRSPAVASAGGFQVPPCAREAGCRLRYRVLLREAARELDDYDRAMVASGAILAPPSAWLLHPLEGQGAFLLAVQTAPGDAFVSGLSLAPPPGKAYRGDVATLDETPYAAFGAMNLVEKRVPGGLVDVAFVPGAPTPAISSWIDGALAAVGSYFGRFPIDHAALLVRIGSGVGVGGGRTMGHGGGAVMISVGEHADRASLADDWVLVHELLHVSFPEVGAPWAEEGLSTYLEPIVRRRAGLCDEDEIWRSLVEGLPKGQPEDGDGGLDVTDTWGRRYWGGAMFWFLADVAIRERTSNARSLDDAILAVNRAGGNVAVRWELARVLEMGDAAIGASVLVPLYARLGRSAVRTDLDGIWKRLGVRQASGKMVYDDAAPLAAVRRGITAGARAPR